MSVRLLGLNPADGLALGGALHLEYTYGVGLLNGLVDGFIVEVDTAQVDVVPLSFLDKLQGFLHLRQCAQAQEVDLDEPGGVDCVLVPVADVRPPWPRVAPAPCW